LLKGKVVLAPGSIAEWIAPGAIRRNHFAITPAQWRGQAPVLFKVERFVRVGKKNE
jgi:hypothetical protein